MSVLGDMALTAGEKLYDTALQYYSQKNLNRQQQANYQKNLKLAASLDIANQRKAIEQSTQALRNAGLSPALAASGNFSAPAVSAAMGSTGQISMSGSSLAQNMNARNERELLEKNKENIESQTQYNRAAAHKAQAEADAARQGASESESRQVGIERENVRSTDYDKTMDLQMRELYKVRAQDSSLTEPQREYWQALADSPEQYTKGVLQAQREFATYLNELDEYQKEQVLRALVKEIGKRQLKNNDVLDALTSAPVTQQKQMLADTADKWSSKKWRDWQRETLGPVQEELLGTESAVKKHSDFVGMVEDGNYFGAAMYLLPVAMTSLGSAAVYAKLLKSGSKAAEKAVETTSNGMPIKIKKGVDSYGNKALSQKDVETWARMQKIKFSDPAAYDKMLKEWNKRHKK